MIYRDYQEGDAPAMAEVYLDSVMGIGPAFYADAQVASWASWAYSDEFFDGLEEGYIVVAETDGRIVSFGQLSPSSHIHLLYTLTDYCRQGIGQQIIRLLEKYALENGERCVTTNASGISMPMFARLGYQLVEKEIAERDGLTFERFRMERKLV